MAKKIIKFFIRAVLILLLALIVLPFLLYIPAIQDFVKEKASQYASENLNIQLSIDRIRLRFPLDLSVDNAMAVTSPGDTLFRSDELRVRVALLPLLKKKVLIDRFILKQASLSYRDTVSQFVLVAEIGKLGLKIDKADLVGEEVRIPCLELADGKVHLSMLLSGTDTTSTDTTAIRWKIIAEKLRISNIDFDMEMFPDETKISAFVETGQLRKGAVDLGEQTVKVESLELTKGSYTYLYDGKAAETKPAPQDSAIADKPWRIEVNRIELKQNNVAYGILQGRPARGVDMNHIKMSDVNLSIDSLYNMGVETRAIVNNLSFAERSGFRVNSVKGRFGMDSTGIILSNFRLETPHSLVQAEAKAGEGILKMHPSTPVDLHFSAKLNLSEFLLLYPLDDEAAKSLFGGKSLQLASNFSGRLNRLNIAELRLIMPGHFGVSATGSLGSVLKPSRLSADLRVVADFYHLSPFTRLLPDTALRNRIALPDSMRLRSHLNVTGGDYSARAILSSGEGRLRVRGEFNPVTERYSMQLAADSFPVYRFLPSDSLGLLTARLNTAGQGFDLYSDSTHVTAALQVERLDYGGYDFGGFSFEANLLKHDLWGKLNSENGALQLDLGLNGTITRQKVAAAIKGNVKKADLNQMGLTPQHITTSFLLDASVVSAVSDSTLLCNLSIDNTELIMAWKKYKLTSASAEFFSANDNVRASVRSGDLSFDFESPVSLESLINGFNRGMAQVVGQMDAIDLNVKDLQQIFPPFTIDASAGRSNIMNNLMRVNGVRFDNFTLSSSLSHETPLRFRMNMSGLSTQGITVDTVLAGMRQSDEKLEYYLRFANKPGNLDNVALIYFYGDVIDNKLALNCRQRDRNGNEGLRFGTNVTLLDSMVTVSFFPENPIIGFQNWTANKDNFLAYHFKSRNLYADVSLQSGAQHFYMQSAPMANHETGAVKLDIAGIDIATLFSLFPVMPPVGGIFGAQLLLGIKEEAIDSDGKITIQDLQYDKHRIGDVDLGILYRYDENQRLNLNLDIDRKEVLTARGSYGQGRRSGKKRANVTVDIPSFPLSVANAFLPPDVGRLSGNLKGKMTLQSDFERMRVNGELQMLESVVNVPMIGTSFRVTEDKIVIKNNIVKFDNYSVIAPNKKPLQVNGSVNIADFSKIMADLTLKANDFQVINVPKNRTSMVYGKASMNLNATVKGALDELTVRGDARLLNGTEAVYVLRGSNTDIKDEQQHIVKFVSFREMAEENEFMYDSIPVQALRIGGMNVLVNVGIDSEVKMSVNLSEDAQNRIDLRGGGNLTYTVNQLGDSRFSGRYALTGGTVRYKPPVISEKSFAIQDGSFVEWNGDIANPSLNITAVEKTKASVQSGNSNRTVNFEVKIIIKNTLENLSITLDLSAPEDIEIQNQIASQSPDQRATQAMNLLIYNTYTSPGESGKFSIDNPLNAFVSQQLNSWARNNLKNVELSFGIDSYDESKEGVGSTRTDYSYKLSKNLFDDRFRISIGGRVSSDADPTENLKQNLVDDISIEYRIGKYDNMFLKLFRLTGYESILEGEVTQTGVGFVVRKKVLKLQDLFKLTRNRKKAGPVQPATKTAESENKADE